MQSSGQSQSQGRAGGGGGSGTGTGAGRRRVAPASMDNDNALDGWGAGDDDWGRGNGAGDNNGDGDGGGSGGGSGTSMATQQILIKNLLDKAQRATRKIHRDLESAKEAVFATAETEVDDMLGAIDKDLDERLLHIEKLVNASHALYTKSADYQSSGIEELLAQLSLGLKEHMQTYSPESETRQNPEKHVSNRTKHAKLLSRKAAMVAVKEKAQSKREEQVQGDVRRFTQAHRDLYKTLTCDTTNSTT